MKKKSLIIVLAVIGTMMASSVFAFADDGNSEYLQVTEIDNIIQNIEDESIVITDEKTGKEYEQDVVVDDIAFKDGGKNIEIASHSDIQFSDGKPVGETQDIVAVLRSSFALEAYADTISYSRPDKGAVVRVDVKYTFSRQNVDKNFDALKLTRVNATVKKIDSSFKISNTKIDVGQINRGKSEKKPTVSFTGSASFDTGFKMYVHEHYSGNLSGGRLSGTCSRGTGSYKFDLPFYLINCTW